MPEPNIPLAGLRMVYPFFFFTMKEGALNAKYRVANRFGNTGCVNEKICKFSAREKR